METDKTWVVYEDSQGDARQVQGGLTREEAADFVNLKNDKNYFALDEEPSTGYVRSYIF